MSDDGNLGVEVAVIGAGLAGLAAATVAARQGISVALLDVRSAGGRARSDQRDDYVLNQGPHAVYRTGAGSGVLSRVGVALQGAPPHPAVAGYRGATGDLAVLPTSAASLLRSPLVGIGDKVRLGRLLTTLPKVDASSLASQSAAGWIDSLGLKPNGAAVLTTLMRVATYAGDLRLISADAAVGQLQLVLEGNVVYLDGGWQTLVDGLVAASSTAGTRLMVGERALAVAAGEGGTWEVTTPARTVRAASLVIAPGGPGRGAGIAPAHAHVGARVSGDGGLPRPRSAQPARDEGRFRARRAALPFDPQPERAPCARRRGTRARHALRSTDVGRGPGPALDARRALRRHRRGRGGPAIPPRDDGVPRAATARRRPRGPPRHRRDRPSGRVPRRRLGGTSRAAGGCRPLERGGRRTCCSGTSEECRVADGWHGGAVTGSGEDFAAERPRLLGLAYRILSSYGDAEDVVQEAWIRWQGVDHDSIESPAAYLTTVVTRLALDRTRTIARRREEYLGPWLPEPIAIERGPEEHSEMAESLTLGFLMLLDRLNPTERAVWLLADVFATPYALISEATGKSEPACRQIATRARRRLPRRATGDAGAARRCTVGATDGCRGGGRPHPDARVARCRRRAPERRRSRTQGRTPSRRGCGSGRSLRHQRRPPRRGDQSSGHGDQRFAGTGARDRRHYASRHHR